MEVKGVPAGSVQVEADLTQLYVQLKRSLELMFGALIIAVLVAITLAGRLQRIFCAPVNELLEVAEKVRTSRKFTLRAHKHSDDELGPSRMASTACWRSWNDAT